MTVRAFVTTLATLVVALSATGANAYYDEDREIDFVESEAWFTPTTTSLGNADHQLGEYLGWSDQAPAAAQAGMTVATAHAGILDIFVEGGRENGSFTAQGNFTGHLDTIALDLYYDSPTDNLCGMALAIDLDIDGTKVLAMDTLSFVPVNSEPAGDYYVAKVALTQIHAALTSLGAAGAIDTEHTVQVVATQYPLCQEAIWMYGSATAPSRLRFNTAPSAKPLKSYTKFDVTNPPVAETQATPGFVGLTAATP